MSTVMIPAKWVDVPEDECIALMAGGEWLGYIMIPSPRIPGSQHLANLGAGMGAPVIGSGSLDECKALLASALGAQ